MKVYSQSGERWHCQAIEDGSWATVRDLSSFSYFTSVEIAFIKLTSIMYMQVKSVDPLHTKSSSTQARKMIQSPIFDELKKAFAWETS